MHDRGLKDLVGVIFPTVSVLLEQTAGALQLRASEVLGSIQSQQILILEETERMQNLMIGQALENLGKNADEWLMGMAVDQIAQLTVHGDVVNTEDGAQVIALNLILKAALELQQRGVLEEEHSEAAQIAVAQKEPDLRLLAGVFDEIDMIG
jgi:hypothetical protein